MNHFTVISILALLPILLPLPLQAAQITLAAVGDIMLAGSGTASFSRDGYDYPFAATRQVIGSADIAVGNLEAPLTSRGEEFTGKRFRFRAAPAAAAALRRAGFSVLTLANNHIMDFGADGLRETVDNLERQNISHAGAGKDLASARRPALVGRKGKRIAFFSYSLTFPQQFFAGEGRPGSAPGQARIIREDIRKARLYADYVVVSFHWGEERTAEPKPYQVATAHLAVDAGADLVIGHHPHVMQGVERYRGGVILYSLGNFAFGSRGKEPGTGILARVTLDEGVCEVELIPLNVNNREIDFQPAVLTGKRASEMMSRLTRLSRIRGTVIVSEGGRYLVRRAGSEAPVVRSAWAVSREVRHD